MTDQQGSKKDLAGSSPATSDAGAESSTVGLKRNINLFNAVTIIVGCIVGSGIFVSPRGVVQEVESVGMALVVWGTCGVMALLGGLCYAELGTTLPFGGGDYAYIQHVWGNFTAFLYIWTQVMIIFPTSNAAIGITFALYVLQPLFPDCASPQNAIRLLAAAAIVAIGAINCISVKWAAKVQNIFTVAKVLALVIIIILGLVALFQGQTANFSDAFEATTTDPGKISIAFYSGIFSYAGWNYLNFMTAEMKNPYRTLPLAIFIGMPLITLIYVLTNIAYFAVLTPLEVRLSEATAVTFGERMMGIFSWCVPVFVAMSCFGGLNGCIMSTSRTFFTAAQQGHLPNVLALIHVKHLTPITAVIFECALSLVMLIPNDVFFLINYLTFAEFFFMLICIAIIPWLRWKQPDLERPIKNPHIVYILFLVICLFLVVFPLYSAPQDIGIGLLIIVLGIPVYWLGVCWENKPKAFQSFMTSVTYTTQKLLVCIPEEEDKDK